MKPSEIYFILTMVCLALAVAFIAIGYGLHWEKPLGILTALYAILLASFVVVEQERGR